MRGLLCLAIAGLVMALIVIAGLVMALIVIAGLVMALIVDGQRHGPHHDVAGFRVVRQYDGDRGRQVALFAAALQGLAYRIGVWNVTCKASMTACSSSAAP